MSTSNIIFKMNYDEFIKMKPSNPDIANNDIQSDSIYGNHKIMPFTNVEVAKYYSARGVKSIFMNLSADGTISSTHIDNDGINCGLTNEPASEYVYEKNIEYLAETSKEKEKLIFINVYNRVVDNKYFYLSLDYINPEIWPWDASLKSAVPIEVDGTYIAKILDIETTDAERIIPINPIIRLPEDFITGDILRKLSSGPRFSSLCRYTNSDPNLYFNVSNPQSYEFYFNAGTYRCSIENPNNIIDSILDGSFDFIEFNNNKYDDKRLNSIIVEMMKRLYCSSAEYPNIHESINEYISKSRSDISYSKNINNTLFNYISSKYILPYIEIPFLKQFDCTDHYDPRPESLTDLVSDLLYNIENNIIDEKKKETRIKELKEKSTLKRKKEKREREV